MAYRKKHKPYILKYKALILKYMACIFEHSKHLINNNLYASFETGLNIWFSATCKKIHKFGRIQECFSAPQLPPRSRSLARRGRRQAILTTFAGDNKKTRYKS